MDWYMQGWRKFAVFQGRSRRREYWTFLLVNPAIVGLLAVVDHMSGMFSKEAGIGLLSFLFCLAIVLPSIAVGIRRLHDIGRSGWWMLLNLIPLVGLVLFVFACFDSQPGDNAYGPNPKTGPGTAAA
jgi:uncharacterized membrane protein YhaH (DUF805 family)